MPQTYPERAARWPGSDQQAMSHLKSRGYVLSPKWVWSHPDNRKLSERDVDAIMYLIEEWDFDGCEGCRCEKPGGYTEEEIAAAFAKQSSAEPTAPPAATTEGETSPMSQPPSGLSRSNHE